MRILTSVAAFAAFASAATAYAAPAEKGTFEHEGYHYTYKVADRDNGSKVITGRRYPGAARFSLVVKNGRVAGTSNGQSISFPVEQAAGAAGEANSKKLSLR